MNKYGYWWLLARKQYEYKRRIIGYLQTNYVKTYKHKSVIYTIVLKYGLYVFRLEILERCTKKKSFSLSENGENNFTYIL